MPQYEYKIVKCRVVDQKYFTSWLATYGWQVQNMQEMVDQVVNQSMGFSSNMGNASTYGNIFNHPYSNSAAFMGSQYSHGWGSQLNTTVTNVKTKLSITFFRDSALPYRSELDSIEARWWKASQRYLDRVIKQGSANDKNWPEFIELQRIDQEARAVRNRKPPENAQINAPAKAETARLEGAENKPVQAPTQAATATIKSMEVTHNVFQSGQPGIQIRLCFTLQNRQGLSCGILAYFFDEKGEALVDLNKKFSTRDGKVCVGASFTPGYDDAIFSDYILFMPYAELDQADGSRCLNFDVRIYDDSGKTFVARSEKASFTFTKNGTAMRGEPTATLTKRVETPRPAKNPKEPPKASTGASTVTPARKKSLAQRKAEFRKNTKWAEQSETYKMYLDGIFEDEEGHHEEALQVYEKVLQLEPNNPTFIIQVSDTLFVLGKPQNSLDVLDEGLKRIPDSPVLIHGKVVAYMRIKEYANAEKCIDQLASLQDRLAQYYCAYSKAILSENREDFKTALSFYDEADRLTPSDGFKFLNEAGRQRCKDQMKRRK